MFITTLNLYFVSYEHNDKSFSDSPCIDLENTVIIILS